MWSSLEFVYLGVNEIDGFGTGVFFVLRKKLHLGFFRKNGANLFNVFMSAASLYFICLVVLYPFSSMLFVKHRVKKTRGKTKTNDENNENQDERPFVLFLLLV